MNDNHRAAIIIVAAIVIILMADVILLAWAADTETVGRAAMMLGAGRQTVDDAIDPSAGLIVHRKLGDEVASGDALVTLCFTDASNLSEVESLALALAWLGLMALGSLPGLPALLGLGEDPAS